jgi:hypothetical protein
MPFLCWSLRSPVLDVLREVVGADANHSFSDDQRREIVLEDTPGG